MTEFIVGKTYQSRKGKAFKVIYVSTNEDYPVIAIDEKGLPESFTNNGRFYADGPLDNEQSEEDLMIRVLFKRGDVVKSRHSGAEMIVTRNQGESDTSFEGVVVVPKESNHKKGTHGKAWASEIFDKIADA